MAAPYGGETQIVDADSRLTVEAPDGTDSTTPVNQWDIFKLAIAGDTASDGSGYKAIPAVAGDDPSEVYLVQALYYINTVNQMGVIWLSGYQGGVRILNYTGTPSVGQSVEVSAANVRKVVGIAHGKGKGLILKVDDATSTVEVLL